jgi:photosystem II stability/assembly factor-like uncharacterized protein
VSTKPSTVPSVSDSAIPSTLVPFTSDPLSRRGFLLRAGQVGCALSIVAPGLSRFLLTTATPGALRNAGLPAPVGSPANSLVGGAADDLWAGLHWRMLGPFRGGRVNSATGVPGRPNEFYFGAVNGGVWKSIDGGRVWSPVFDGQPVASIGAVTVAPSAPDTVYVGTGENTLRDSMGFGNGVFKTTDAGRTWTHLGLTETHHIGRIAVDPRNANVVFVAAIGKLYAPSPERGVFRSRDGGKSWEKVLFKNNDVGAVEVVIDPTNSNVVYAGLWNTRRPPWYTYGTSTGPGGGMYKSTDGGTTWKEMTNGLPKSGIGRTGIGLSASNPRRVYAVIDCQVADPNAPAPTEAASGAGGGGRGGAAAVPQQGGFFRAVGTGLVFHQSQRRPEECRYRLRAQRGGESLDGRRPHLGRTARLAGRR